MSSNAGYSILCHSLLSLCSFRSFAFVAEGAVVKGGKKIAVMRTGTWPTQKLTLILHTGIFSLFQAQNYLPYTERIAVLKGKHSVLYIIMYQDQS